jgi:abhydrolase domain-containing protein 6
VTRIRWVVLILALPLAVLAGAWAAVPTVFLGPLVSLNRGLSGLSERVVEVGRHRVHYLEGGQGETVVLLHGIFAEKDHWLEFARGLTGSYRVIVPDLPGYGASSRLDDESYAYAAQVARLHEFLERIGAEEVHLAGSSMGGTIAALYAIEHPERVRSLAMIGAPHGIRSPTPSEADRRIAAGGIPLIARSAREFDGMLEILFANRPLLPRPIVVSASREAVRRAPSNVRLWEEQRRDAYLLQEQLPRVVTRTLVVWGAEDRVFHVSGAEVVRRSLPGQEVVVLPQVGHLPMMEQPKQTAALYTQFLQRRPREAFVRP